MNTFKKLLALLNRRERRQLYLMLAGTTLSALIEVAGIVSVLPFLAVVANPEIVQQNPILHWAYELLGFSSVNRFLVFLGAGVFVVLTASNGFVALLTWAMLRYTWMRNYSLSRRLMAGYLSRPYVFFLNRNSSELSKNILGEVNKLITGVILPGLTIVAKSMVTLAILAMLMILDPVLAIVVAFVLGGAYSAVFWLIRKKLHGLGQERFEANTARFKSTNETFSGIKYVKLLGIERGMLSNFSEPSYRLARNMSTSQLFGQLPRFALELIAFGGILLIVLFLLVTGEGLRSVLPLIGLYAFAGYRLMPALQAIFQHATTVRFNLPVIERLYDDLEGARRAEVGIVSSTSVITPLPFNDSIVLKDVTFRYPGAATPVLQNLSLEIQARRSTAFVGATGAGKTTVVDLILGLLRPQSGRMLVDGIELTDEILAAWQANLGYVPQDIFLQDSTVAENIAFGMPQDQIDMERVVRAARTANIHDFVVDELPQQYETLIGERGVRLSGGQRQRIGIAQALYRDPEVLVMDEATSALDGRTEQAVLKAMARVAEVKTFILIAHRLTTIQHCDAVHLLDHGKIVTSGTYDELMDTQQQLREMTQVGVRSW